MAQPSNDSWKPLYPFASHYLVLDGRRMHYVDEGRGRPLLLVHGNPTWSFYWRRLIAALRDRYRVVAVDHLGCGLSDKPRRYPYQLARHIDNLVHLVEHLDLQQTVLVAHDWGGPIGTGTLLRLRERFAAMVLLNTGTFPPPFIPWRIRACRIPILGTLAVRGLNLFARAAIHMAVARTKPLPADVRAGLLAPYDSWSHRVAIDRFVKDIPASPRHPTWETLQSIEDGLANLGPMPCLLVWGMRDWCFRPECLERIEQLRPDATVVPLDDAGHYVMEDAPDDVIAAVERLLGQLPAV